MALLDEVKTEPAAAASSAAADDIHSGNNSPPPRKMPAADSAEIKATPVASPPPLLPATAETEMVPLLPGVGTATIVKREARSPSPAAARTMVANGSLKHQGMTR